MTSQNQIRGHFIVEGRVQGVFYRATTYEVAQKLKLTGWVRNLPDGNVEVLAEGEKAVIEALFDFLKKGPVHAIVIHITESYSAYQGEFRDFTIRY